ncbi:E3 ubiquitin-protein ligase [Dendrobium catenatum]|uniref:RING-type E3 ubiquitin transferase n=1 Tax=Dendrobium catenatum TaxID=906689 RepID=A0A2I0VWT4_9ASPA|nr:E3 ubiquitin-protein ligase [Dendrobium catenatum]
MCAVCLSKFNDGEDIKLLPECKHCFHVQCIDMWLQSHSSCPLCRVKTKTVTEKNKENVKEASPAGNCGEKGKGHQMCAVCLSKFDDGEDIKVLPECKHCFHVQCIDLWLKSHSSCPLCRVKTKTVTEKNKEKVKGASPAGNCAEKGGGWTASWFWWTVAEDSVIWI